MKLRGIVALGLLGVTLIVAGVAVQQLFPSLMAGQLEAKLKLYAESPTVENFIAPPIPIWMQFYFFNVTNPAEILNGETPKLNQMGPFSYFQKRHKYNIKWNHNDDTVTFKQNKTYTFRKDMSYGLGEEEYVTTINPLLISLVAKASSLNKLETITHSLIQILKMRYSIDIFITKKVRELIFEGYREKMLDLLATVKKDPKYESGRFGFFYPRNHTDDGTFTVGTGGNGLDKIQIIKEWKESPKLPYWKTDYCNMINGTDASQFPQPITPETNISLFSSDMCRSVDAVYERVAYRGNLKLLRFVIPLEAFEKSPKNDCFCSDEFTCQTALLNIGPCKDGAPVVVSTPHFYMGTNELITGVDGLNPNKEEHETFIEVEPNSGIPFRATKRLQLNMPLRRYSALPQLSKVKEVIFPIVWANESATVPLEKADELYSKLTIPVLVVKYACWTMLGIGALLIFLSVIHAIKWCRRPADEEDKKSKKPTPVNEYDKTDGCKQLCAT